jgi:Zn-dependent peptidase ImmA (M78 family)
LPVDVVILVEKSEGIDLDYWPGLRANHQVEGMVARDRQTGDLFIFIDEELADDDSRDGRARFRMAVAEELAHVHLHRSLINRVESPEGFCELHRHPQWTDVERDAKLFAQMLLMPTKRLLDEARETFENIVQRPEIQARLNDSARAYKSLSDPIKRQLSTLLARRFGVMERQMVRRLASGYVKVFQSIDEALERGLDTLP